MGITCFPVRHTPGAAAPLTGVGLAVLALTLAALVPAQGGSPAAAAPPPEGEMVFMTLARPELGARGYEIATMNLDGTNLRRITENTMQEFLPHFSPPDGKKLVFTRFTTGSYGDPGAVTRVVVYDFATGTEADLGEGYQPVWSPDGSRLAFLCNRFLPSSLCLMNADGSGARAIGRPGGTETDSVWGDPAWSSDDWILFVVAQNVAGCFKTRLDKMRPDGTGRTQVTDGGGNCTPPGREQCGDADPGFSADGQTIYTSRGFPDPPDGAPSLTVRRLFRVDSGAWSPGKPEADLSAPGSPACVEGVPKGSPDGSRVLLFRHCPGEGPSGIFLTDTRGSFRSFLVEGFGPDWHPLGGGSAPGNHRPPTTLVPARPDPDNAPARPLRFSLGNMSVPLLLQAWGNSQLLPPGTDLSPAAHRREVADYVAKARACGVSALEDYVGWGAVEPARDQWAWDLYREDQASVRAAGLGYTPYVWVHNLPGWAREDSSFVRARCLEHHQTSESSLSVFSASTADLYERVYAQLEALMGEPPELLRFATPNDYGEAAYTTGVAAWAFPDRHVHVGFWVDEPEARADFRNAMTLRYRSIGRLNAAWGTRFAAFGEIDYPADASQPRRWLDFIGWYHDARTERIGALMDVARRHFPNTTISLNLGFPDERISYGQDPTGIAKMLAQKGFQPRVPNGYPVPYLVTRRTATAARLYRIASLATEPAQDYSGSSDDVRCYVAESLFRDLTMGVTLHFDYANNFLKGKPAITEALSTRRGDLPAVDTALFFSTTSHRLDTSRDSDGLFKGYPDGLVDIAEGLRDILDYDVLDERLVEDGFLDRYNVLIWPVGLVTEAGTLHSLRAWIDKGGILIAGSLGAIRTVENDRGAFADLPFEATGRIRVGNGFVYDLAGGRVDLASVVASRAYVTADATPVAGPFLAPLDTAFDGVLVSQFETGLLLFNRGSTAVTRPLAMPPGPWRISYPNLPSAVTLPPGVIRWFDGRTGR